MSRGGVHCGQALLGRAPQTSRGALDAPWAEDDIAW